jgi:hypothetical protein
MMMFAVDFFFGTIFFRSPAQANFPHLFRQQYADNQNISFLPLEQHFRESAELCHKREPGRGASSPTPPWAASPGSCSTRTCWCSTRCWSRTRWIDYRQRDSSIYEHTNSRHSMTSPHPMPRMCPYCNCCRKLTQGAFLCLLAHTFDDIESVHYGIDLEADSPDTSFQVSPRPLPLLRSHPLPLIGVGSQCSVIWHRHYHPSRLTS